MGIFSGKHTVQYKNTRNRSRVYKAGPAVQQCKRARANDGRTTTQRRANLGVSATDTRAGILKKWHARRNSTCMRDDDDPRIAAAAFLPAP